MLRQDFYFDLPDELIAQAPLASRSAGRLLCLDGPSAQREDRYIADFPDILRPGDLLVCNNTRVLNARLFGVKASGGKVEVLIERVLDQSRVLAHVRASKSPKPGSSLLLEPNLPVTVLGREDALFELRFNGEVPVTELLEQHGHVPLPPYINRGDTDADHERYQTVFAARPGAVAAPTAGLHFDAALLAAVRARGVQLAEVTLHVGAGTFQPVRADRLEDHHMHSEWLEVTADVVQAVADTRARGGRVVALGTTSVRALETAAADGQLKPFEGDSQLFLYPGCRFNVVDAMLTNFHLPESTLLMLVCAFAGQEAVLNAYRHAVDQRYRFFSYGDAMFLTRKIDAV